jgi:hypothetical protein
MICLDFFATFGDWELVSEALLQMVRICMQVRGCKVPYATRTWFNLTRLGGRRAYRRDRIEPGISQ